MKQFQKASQTFLADILIPVQNMSLKYIPYVSKHMIQSIRFRSFCFSEFSCGYPFIAQQYVCGEWQNSILEKNRPDEQSLDSFGVSRKIILTCDYVKCVVKFGIVVIMWST